MAAAQLVGNCLFIWGCSVVFVLISCSVIFFEVLHSKLVSTSKNAPRVDCLDHADTQGVLLRSFRISGYSWVFEIKRKGPTGWKGWKVIAQGGLDGAFFYFP